MIDSKLHSEMEKIAFFVPGIPRPGGSKRVFPIRKGGILTGKFIVTDAAGQANKDWRAIVALAGRQAMEELGESPLSGALTLELEFGLLRPKGHFNSRGILKPSSPLFPITRPDVGKLARSTQDALTSIVWQDDAQIVKETHSKAYGVAPGCVVRVRQV